MNTHFQTACGGALLAFTLAAQAAGTLLVTPPASNVAVGQSFDVMVRGSGFTDNVIGGGFNLAFDPGVLALASVSVDTAVWEFASSNGQIDNVLGTLSDVYFNSFRAVLPTGDFAVATLQFTALAAGFSALTLSESVAFPFANDMADVITVGFQGGDVSVSAVPEPGSWALALAGLAVVGQLMRRRAA